MAFHLQGRQAKQLLLATTRFELRSYLVELEEQGLAPTSVQRKLASLRGLFAWLQRQGQIEKNPARLLKGPKAPRRVPRFLATAEVDQCTERPGTDCQPSEEAEDDDA